MMAEVLPPGESSSHFSGLRRTSSHNYLNTDLTSAYLQPTSSRRPYDNTEYGSRQSSSLPSSAPSSPQLSSTSFMSQRSYPSTAASSLSLDAKADNDYDEDIMFPSYDGAGRFQHEEDVTVPSMSVSSPDDEDMPLARARSNSIEKLPSAGDDQTIEKEPTRHVDYLSHEWKEEDIWSSWRYIVARRGVYSNSTRLENASWRTWAKSKGHLKTISPETLNWLKDCDVTWLYGPLQTDAKKPMTTESPLPQCKLHRSNSYVHKKPILKKRSASEAILQRSISAHSLLKHAGAILKAQEASPSKARPAIYRATSDFSAPFFSRSSTHNTPATEETFTLNVPSAKGSVTSSGAQTPSSERRHIHFNNEVVQCIAVEKEGADYDEEEAAVAENDESEEDEGIVMMKPAMSRPKPTHRTPRGSFSNDGKTIALLPSTTLRGDTPEPSEAGTPKSSGIWPGKSKLSASPSQETLRPSNSANFLLDDDDEAADFEWEPSSRGFSIPLGSPEPHDYEDETEPGPGMHRTPSGMFMPYDEDEDEAAMNNTLFGKVVDTVNTARDIAHVIWNVGWRR